MKRRSRSIRIKLLIPIMFMVFVQIIVFFSIVYTFNVTELSDNSYALLDKTMTMKISFFQSDLDGLIKNVKAYNNIVSGDIESIAEKNNIDLSTDDIKDDAQYILNESMSDIIDLSRSNMVTGAYLILENGETKKPAIYIRNTSPEVMTNDNSDLLAEVGKADFIKSRGISLDSNWSPRIEISEGDSFYNVPFKAGNYYEDIEAIELGYWADVHEFNGLDVITYSMPLVDKNHKAYGVIGIEVSLDYLAKVLPDSELDFGNTGSYMIVKKERESDNFIEEFVGKSIWNKLLVSNKQFEIKKENYEYKIYSIYDPDTKERVYCLLKPLDMYNSNTPFEDEVWSLAISAEREGLFEGIYKLNNLFIKAIIIIVIISLLTVIIVSKYFTKPIQNLMKELRESDPSKQLSLRKIDIEEIDELSSVIEKLNKDVAYSASRLTQMIDLVNISIGAIEYDEKLGFCKLSGDAYEMLDFSDEFYLYTEQKYNDYSKEFEKFKNKVVKIVKTENKDIYTCEVHRNDGRIVWLRFSIKKQEDRQIIVLIDVTEEVLHMKRVEYERDHDNLTGLLNRAAFEGRCNNILLEKPKVVGMVMWDLDNLKHINDNYGHELGDKYIIKTATILRGLERAGALVSRRSGDEFFAIVYGLDDEKEIYDEIFRVHNELINTDFSLADDKTIKIKASGGVVYYPKEANNVQDLVKYADFAMYDAKSNDKGTLKRFNMEKYKKSDLFMDNK